MEKRPYDPDAVDITQPIIERDWGVVDWTFDYAGGFVVFIDPERMSDAKRLVYNYEVAPELNENNAANFNKSGVLYDRMLDAFIEFLPRYQDENPGEIDLQSNGEVLVIVRPLTALMSRYN